MEKKTGAKAEKPEKPTAYAEFVADMPNLKMMTECPGGNVLFIACGDGEQERFPAAHKLSKKAMPCKHTAYMAVAGGPLMLADSTCSAFLLEQVKFFVAHKEIATIHVCTHADCGMAKVKKYTWAKQKAAMEKVVAKLKKIKTVEGAPVEVVSIVYGEKANPNLYVLA